MPHSRPSGMVSSSCSNVEASCSRGRLVGDRKPELSALPEERLVCSRLAVRFTCAIEVQQVQAEELRSLLSSFFSLSSGALSDTAASSSVCPPSSKNAQTNSFNLAARAISEISARVRHSLTCSCGMLVAKYSLTLEIHLHAAQLRMVPGAV